MPRDLILYRETAQLRQHVGQLRCDDGVRSPARLGLMCGGQGDRQHRFCRCSPLLAVWEYSPIMIGYMPVSCSCASVDLRPNPPIICGTVCGTD